jgi:hypothetical protein
MFLSACLLVGLLWLVKPVDAREPAPFVQDSPVAPNNTPPVAEFTVDPPSGVVGTRFMFDPSASHDNEDPIYWLAIRFDWNGDGFYDTGWLNPTDGSPETYFDVPGVYTVTMEIKDSGDLTDTVSHAVQVGDPGSNTKPTARCEVTPLTGKVGTTFTFSAASSSDQQSSQSELVAMWDWYGSGTWTTTWLPLTQTQTLQFNSTGLHTVRVRVRDTGLLSDDAECTVDVQSDQPNTAPTASFTISPTTGTITTEFTLDPTGSQDKEDSLPWLQVRFDWTNDGTFDTGFLNASQTWVHIFSDVWGDITVRMEVQDKHGLGDQTTRTVHVITPYQIYLPEVQK